MVGFKKYARNILEAAVLFAILALLYYFAQLNYLLFHSLAEMFSIIIASGIFFIGFNARKYMNNGFLLFLGIAYFFIAFLDLLHTFSYEGMNIFAATGPDLATQLWIAARYMEAVSILTACFFIKRKIRITWTFIGYLIITGAIITSIFYLEVFPTMYLEGTGLTRAKVVSEYIIMAIILAAIFLVYRNRHNFSRYIYRLLLASFSLTILQELAFTLYLDVYGHFNLAGHFLKILSFYLLYKAIIETGLRQPYQLIFNDLVKSRDKIDAYSKRLKQLNDDLNAFAYSLSHDTRSMLRKVNYQSYLISERCGHILDEECRNYISEIKRSTTSMENIFEGLLKLYNITTRKINRKRLDFSRAAGTMANYLKKMEKDRKIIINVQENIQIYFDEDLLNIMLMNLIENAIKYTRDRDTARIEIGGAAEDGKMLYFIKDNGEGMPVYFKSKNRDGYKPFVKRSGRTEGYGIGLVIVKKIVDIFEGEMWYDSKEQEGTTFYLRFKEAD